MEFYPQQDTSWEDERPPTYNPEDYAAHLSRFTAEAGGDGQKDARETMGQDMFSYEMGLRQFRSVSELMSKLMYDLQVSYDSFVQEFIRYPNNGVTRLCDLLKVIQLSQTNHKSASHASVRSVQSDEFQTLLCLKLCAESEEGATKILEHGTGLFTVAVCVMSNFSKSRVLALQLLTRLCSLSGGHDNVADSMSMLRLKFGEPVRFKFLIGMLNSWNGSSFQVSCLRFINTFIKTAPSAKKQVQIQCELEEAGFDIPLLKMVNSKNGASSSLLKEELEVWNTRFIDVNELVKENKILHRNIETLMERINVLENNNNNVKKSEELNDDVNNETENAKEKKLALGSKNKISISVSDGQKYTSEESISKHRKYKKITKIDLSNLDADPAERFLEDFEFKRRERQQTALSRCKSFLGFKTRNIGEDFAEERSRSAEDNFILKTDGGLGGKARERVKRSKSMDIFRRGMFQHQGKKDFPVVTKSYSQYCKNKIDYVKKWQKDSMQYEMKNQPSPAILKNNYFSNKNSSFYSLYF